MSDQKKLKIAVIQLTRIGDLIQTLQATRQFRAENPETEITLIAHKKFASGLTFLLETVFDDIILIETKNFFQGLELQSVQRNLSAFLSEINQREFDVTVNLSFSKSSSYLNTLIKSQLTLGMSRNNRSEIVINDKWSQYVYSNIMSSPCSPFGLVDIYRYIFGCQDVHKLNDDPERITTNSIVLHPFASDRKKRWGTNRWVELIYKLSKDHPNYTFHIVGAPEDHLDAEKIIDSPALAEFKERVVNQTGIFKLSDTYQALQKAKLFIGHDSVVSHIASETLTKSIVLSLGTVRPHETTAYNEGVINIAPRNKCYPCTMSEKCDLLPCHNSISHQAVATIGAGLLKGDNISYEFLRKNISGFHLDSIKVFKSEYSSFGLNLREVSANYDTVQDVFKNYYRVIWQLYLRDHEIQATLPDLTPETSKELQGYLEGINNLFDLYNFGIKFSNRIVEECGKDRVDSAVIKDSLAKLTEIDQLCNVTKAAYPLLAGLIDFFFVHKGNVAGDDILEVAHANLLAYYDASNLASVLNEFIEKSIGPQINKVSNSQNI